MIQYRAGLNQYLDLAGEDLGILGAGGTDPNFARDFNDRLSVQLGCGLEDLLGQVGRIKYCLRAPFPVAEINEENPSQIPAGMNPTNQSDSLASMSRPKFVTMLRAFHVRWTGDLPQTAKKRGYCERSRLRPRHFVQKLQRRPTGTWIQATP